MGRFFDIEGPFIEGLNKISDIFFLNLLLIVCSLPVFTAGAAYTAVYYVTLKMVKNEDCYTFKSFFKSFKLNFRQATLIWLIMIVIGAILLLDIKIMGGGYGDIMSLSSGVPRVMSVIFMAAAIFYLFEIVYVFPVLSKFDNTIKNTFKNAFIMSVRHFPYTVLVIVITFVPIVLMYLFPRLLIIGFFTFGLSAYINSFIFVKIFKNYMPEETIVSDENFTILVEKEAENNEIESN